MRSSSLILITRSALLQSVQSHCRSCHCLPARVSASPSIYAPAFLRIHNLGVFSQLFLFRHVTCLHARLCLMVHSFILLAERDTSKYLVVSNLCSWGFVWWKKVSRADLSTGISPTLLSSSIHFFKRIVHPKCKCCHELLTLMSFQTRKTFVHLRNTN